MRLETETKNNKKNDYLHWKYGSFAYLHCSWEVKKEENVKRWNIFSYPNVHLRGAWFVFSNNYFQFLNNITRIFTHFFTHTYFHKYFQTTIFNF